MSDPIKSEFTQFQEAVQEVKDLNLKTPAYEFFLSTVTAAENKMEALHKTKRNRLAPVLTDADRRELLQLHAKIGHAAEIIIQSKPDPELGKKVRKLTALAAGNYRTIKAYDPAKEAKSLPELLEDARAVTLNTSGVQMEEGMGGRQSERRPIAYIDEKGNKIAGVFTAKQNASYVEDVKKVFADESNDTASPMTEGAKTMLRNFVSGALPVASEIYQQNRNQEYDKEKDKTDEAKLTTLLWGLSLDRETNPQYLKNALIKVYPQLQGQNLDRVFGKGTLQRLCRKLDPLMNTISLHVDSARIPDGSRLDTRNAAMYGAADLLGVPHLVAKAVPMKLIGPNGEVTEGTFMHKAKGYDINNLPPAALNFGEHSLNDTSGKGYKDLADLQVLDYICGNIDRHGANMFYRFDRNGKFCGVQAIDNDTALGGTAPSGEENIIRLVVPKNMKVMSESMYNKVVSLTPDELKFALRGYNLSEYELRCAAWRLNKLQEELKKENCPIRIMKDKDFKKLNAQKVKSLCVVDPRTQDPLNLFALGRKMVRNIPGYRMAQQKQFRDLEQMVAIGEDNRALPGSQMRESNNVDILKREMDRVTVHGFWHFHKGTSAEFEEMRRAVINYGEYQKRIQDRINGAKQPGKENDPDAPSDAIVRQAELEEMARLSKIMKDKANAYLEKKAGSRFNSYTNSRKQIARLVQSFGENRETVKDIERQTQEKLNQQADVQSKRILERQKLGQAGPQL